MKSAQEIALMLLDELTPEMIRARRKRGKNFLPSASSISPDLNTIPQNWPGGWCEEWAYSIGPNFATALDVQLTPRVQGLEWTQGSAFNFRAGYTIYKTPKAYDRWEDALKHVDTAIQIRFATPAVPAHIEYTEFDSETEMLETAETINNLCELELCYPKKLNDRFRIKVFVQREPGKIVYEMYTRADSECRLLPQRPFSLYRTTQDAFVRMLITGVMTTEPSGDLSSEFYPVDFKTQSSTVHKATPDEAGGEQRVSKEELVRRLTIGENIEQKNIEPYGGSQINFLTFPIPDVYFEDSCFCLTGDFVDGKKTIQDRIAEAGGSFGQVNRVLDYLVVGSLGSRSWKYGTHGLKVRDAMELNRQYRGDIEIISEATLLTALMYPKPRPDSSLHAMGRVFQEDYEISGYPTQHWEGNYHIAFSCRGKPREMHLKSILANPRSTAFYLHDGENTLNICAISGDIANLETGEVQTPETFFEELGIPSKRYLRILKAYRKRHTEVRDSNE